VRAAIEDIVIASARGIQVIESLRTMFRKGAGRRASFDVNKLVREVVAMLDVNLRAEQVSVSTKLREGLPHLLADQAQLQQVFLNLIVNAIDAMRSVDRAEAPRWLPCISVRRTPAS
jgi:C4-dicarboxylate-specific signal transduction histidine kinase